MVSSPSENCLALAIALSPMCGLKSDLVGGGGEGSEREAILGLLIVLFEVISKINEGPILLFSLPDSKSCVNPCRAKCTAFVSVQVSCTSKGCV